MTRRTTAAGLLALAAAAFSGCGGRPAVPDLAGPLAWVVVEASMAGDPLAVAGVPGPAAAPALLLDSIAFPRLGAAAGGGSLTRQEVERQLGRGVAFVDPMDVLECPSREPCRVRGDAIFLTVWGAQPARDGLTLVVNRVQNVRGLYVMTAAVTHRLELRRTASGWQLTGRTRI